MSQSKKIFLTDIDGCVLNWSAGIKKYLEHEHSHIELDYDCYHFGIDLEEFDVLARKFNRSSYFKHLPLCCESLKYITKIHKEFGYSFVGITSCLASDNILESAKTINRRKDNLEKYFGDIFEECYCVPFHHTKRDILSNYDHTFWVDDKMEHCRDAHDIGHTSMFMVHPYNKHKNHEHVLRMNSWKEIYDYVKKYENKNS